MPRERHDPAARRAVVPDAAGHSLLFSAVWTGVGAAVVCALVAVIAVAVCWLPVSGASGHGGHTIAALRAGLLTALAAVHGGITVDGTEVAWLPLGLTLLVGVIAWRAGAGLADAAAAGGTRDTGRLAGAAAVQAAAFAGSFLVLVPFARLGTSAAPFLPVGAAAFVVFAVFGWPALVINSPLRERCSRRVTPLVATAVRVSAGVLLVELAAAALLVAGSLAVHHGTVSGLTRQVGGGWGGVPVLLLDVLAAPNALVAGASYLAGPGFAVGTGSSVTAWTATTGTVPAFPLLGALPGGTAGVPTLVLMAVTVVGIAVVAARLAARDGALTTGLAGVGAGAVATGIGGALLAWQAGGALGTGRLAAVGASPWRFGGALLLETGAGGAVALLALVARRALQASRGGRTVGGRRDIGLAPVVAAGDLEPELDLEGVTVRIPYLDEAPAPMDHELDDDGGVDVDIDDLDDDVDDLDVRLPFDTDTDTDAVTTRLPRLPARADDLAVDPSEADHVETGAIAHTTGADDAEGRDKLAG